MSRHLVCCDERRQDEVRGRADINGIDFLEVLDLPSMPDADRQRTLFVHFLNDPTGLPITPQNILIEGGDRLRPPDITAASIAVDPRSFSTQPVLVVELARPGDFSIHTLSLVETPSAPGALAILDPVLRSVPFSFKAACESDFDAALATPCPTPAPRDIGLDYRARDFRPLLRLLQDRYAGQTGDAETGHPADPATTLLELLAHAGDQLAWRQDVAATEAKLDTARLRVSARRHARLLDERMRDGSSARVLAQIAVDGAPATIPPGTRLVTAVAGLPRHFAPTAPHWPTARTAGAIVFETIAPITAHPALNEIPIHAWGDRACTLPRGATAATLRGDLAALLQPGDLLVFGEVASPRTGAAADADLARRHAVRLLTIAPATDPIGGAFDIPPVPGPMPVTEITWHADDALPWPLVVSAEAATGAAVPVAALAWGNIVPADHGSTLEADEPLGAPPPPRLARLPADTAPRVIEPGTPEGCLPCPPVLLPARWQPELAEAPLSRTIAHDRTASARAFLEADPAAAEPAILSLTARRDDLTLETWHIVPDLLRSGDARHAVAETQEGGRVRLRFGRDGTGRPPAAHAEFRIRYRVGAGAPGNIGADSLAHLVTADALLLARADGEIRVRNPLAATGGTEPETVETLRRRAPHAFAALQRRAVTLPDHEARAREHGGIQQASARLRWSGSWHNLCLAADRLGGRPIDDEFADSLARHMQSVRLMGQGLNIERPLTVAIDLDADITLADGQSRAEMRRALMAALSGPGGIFDPDRLTFGQTVHLSPIVATLQAVDGVRFLRITRFERRDAPGPEGINRGALHFARRELPRLSDDPNHPEHGTLTLTLRGGR
jgi:hypothetical protein